jgi:hypothetical protein
MGTPVDLTLKPFFVEHFNETVEEAALIKNKQQPPSNYSSRNICRLGKD